jgi:hypothetical protein
MTPDQLATIKAKVQGTPALLALWDAGTPVPIADALSDPADATYGGTVTLTSTTKADLLTALRPALATLPQIAETDAAKVAKWDRVLAWILAADPIRIDAHAVGLFTAATADGVLTGDEAAACYQRAGSYAEVQFGAGASIDWFDVCAAMNS